MDFSKLWWNGINAEKEWILFNEKGFANFSTNEQADIHVRLNYVGLAECGCQLGKMFEWI